MICKSVTVNICDDMQEQMTLWNSGTTGTRVVEYDICKGRLY